MLEFTLKNELTSQPLLFICDPIHQVTCPLASVCQSSGPNRTMCDQHTPSHWIHCQWHSGRSPMPLMAGLIQKSCCQSSFQFNHSPQRPLLQTKQPLIPLHMTTSLTSLPLTSNQLLLYPRCHHEPFNSATCLTSAGHHRAFQPATYLPLLLPQAHTATCLSSLLPRVFTATCLPLLLPRAFV